MANVSVVVSPRFTGERKAGLVRAIGGGGGGDKALGRNLDAAVILT